MWEEILLTSHQRKHVRKHEWWIQIRWYLTDGKIILLRERNMVEISLKSWSFENDALANSEHIIISFTKGHFKIQSLNKNVNQKKKKNQDPEAKKEE